MEFGIELCVMLIIKSVKRHMMDGMELPSQEKKLECSEKRKRTNMWKYWRMTQLEMKKKKKLKKEDLRRTRKLLETKLYNRNKKPSRIVVFAILADQRLKLEESEKRDKYLNFARELKKLWNMKVTVMPIVIGAPGAVTKGSVLRLEDTKRKGWVETI